MGEMILKTWGDPPFLEYREVHGREAYGNSGGFGIRIFATVSRELSDGERTALYQAYDMIEAALRSEDMRLDHSEQSRRAEDRTGLIGLFPDAFAVQDIPNGYCSRWCCSQKPWYRVLTRIGWITIGWRKSVINIDWTETIVASSGEELFPNGKFTASGKYDKLRFCHAWGYDAARTQLATILSQGAAAAATPQAKTGDLK